MMAKIGMMWRWLAACALLMARRSRLLPAMRSRAHRRQRWRRCGDERAVQRGADAGGPGRSRRVAAGG